MSKVLIAYFSRKGNNYVNGNIVKLPVGNTETAAKMLQEITGGDLFEIQTVHAYSEDYHTCTEEAQKELRAGARPELMKGLPDISRYHTVYLGYPNWWGTMPMGVYTFLESYDFAGKTICPFCTHEGSGMGHSQQELKKLCPTARIEKGLAIRGGSVKNAQEQLRQWAEAQEKSRRESL